ncbi:MAG: hypothetical protein HQL55_17925 [Magnetococcales bacterium]|nr:hypothetical protein [Magnetococcales bacterium]
MRAGVMQVPLLMMLISQVVIAGGDVKVHLRAEGLGTLARELNDLWNQKEDAA